VSVAGEGTEPGPGDGDLSPNPKYLMISFFEGEDKDRSSVKTVQNPTIYDISNLGVSTGDVNEQSMESLLMKILKEQVEKNGTIEEIRFRGHGGSGNIGAKSGKYYILTCNFLDEVAKLEKELGTKIVNRIVFDGCNTFSALNDYFINYYSEYAKKHEVQIVGATSETESFAGLSAHIGRFVQFAPDGNIIRDTLDTRFNPLTLLLENDRSWTDYYIGHTVEDGAMLKKTHDIQQENQREAETKRQELENKRADFGPKW